MNNINYILLTGQPGVGKTTLVHNICKNLTQIHKIKCSGFFTEEVRDMHNQRIGFDVVCLDGTRGVLARSSVRANINRAMVGKYAVYVQEFEDTVLPTLCQPNIESNILIIDEIGKMELLSKRFCAVLNDYLESNKIILGTIPLKYQRSLSVIEKLRSNSKTKLFVVTKSNRDELLFHIIDVILSVIKC